MFSQSAELYDLIYQQFKDYREESRRIAALLSRIHPAAKTVLDVACGTGEHARFLREHGYRVDGLDLEPAFVHLARQKNPGSEFFCADMINFEVASRYDAVLCLFSSIGYVKTLENVRCTLSNFRRHLDPGGVVVVEPWFAPGQWQTGSVFMKTAEVDGLKVCRMSHSVVQGQLSVLEFQYLVGRAAGIDHRTEVHQLGLFTTDEMHSCFIDAGLDVIEYDQEGLIGRGLFVARQPISDL